MFDKETETKTCAGAGLEKIGDLGNFYAAIGRN